MADIKDIEVGSNNNVKVTFYDKNNNIVEELKKYLEEWKEYYKGGVVTAMSESLTGEKILGNALDELEKLKKKYEK